MYGNKIIIVLAALFLINPGSLALINDVNQDGQTNIGDVIMLEEMVEMTGDDHNPSPDHYDFNGDDQVNQDDVRALYTDFDLGSGTLGSTNDVDDDGYHEDLNGDGVLTREDVELLFGNLDRVDVENFDYDKDGNVDIDEATRLYREGDFFETEDFVRNNFYTLIRYDKNQDGNINSSEYHDTVELYSEGEITAYQMKVLLEVLDNDYKQYLEINSLQGSEIEDYESFTQENLEILRIYDENRDGRISDTELRYVVSDWKSDVVNTDDLLDMVTSFRAGKTDQYNYQDYMSREIAVSLGERFTVSPGDEVNFEDESFTVEGFETGINPKIANIIPDGNVDTGASDSLNLLEGYDSYQSNYIEFESGTFQIVPYNVESDTAEMKIERVLSKSSPSFECDSYQTEENQYKFCSDTEGEDTKTVDLGHTERELTFVSNKEFSSDTDDTGTVFVDRNSHTLNIGHETGFEYMEAQINVIEWKGLRSEHGGAGKQVVIEVDPVQTQNQPDATIDFGANEYSKSESATLTFEAFEPGRYELRIAGAGISDTRKYSEDETSDVITIEPGSEGYIETELVAPGGWWNPLNSDEVVDTATVQVNNPEQYYQVIRPEYPKDNVNGKVEDIEEMTEIKFGNNHQNSLFITSFLTSGTQYGSIIGYVSSVNEENRIRFHQDFDNGFNTQEINVNSGKYYMYICGSSDSKGVDIGLQKEDDNAASTCTGSNQGDKSEYTLRGYNPGELVEVKPGEGLEWGQNKLYVKSMIDYGNSKDLEAYAQVLERHQIVAASEKSRVEGQFYDGNYFVTFCEPREDAALIHVSENREDISQTCPGETDSNSFGETVKLEVGETADFEGKSIYLDSIYEAGASVSSSEARAQTSTTNLANLDQINPVPIGGENYAISCQTDLEANTATLTMVDERTNPFDVCDVTPSDIRNGNEDYIMKDYTLEEPVNLTEGEGITFGDSAIYIDNIEDSIAEGFSETVNDVNYHTFQTPASEGLSSTEWLLEGEVGVGLCGRTDQKVKFVLKDTETFSGGEEWPEAWCQEEIENNRCTYQITGQVNGANYSSDTLQRVYLESKNTEESGFTSLSSTNSFDWTSEAECGSSQELIYRREGQELASRQIELPENDQELSFELDVDEDRREESEDVIRAENTLELQAGSTIEIGNPIEVSADISEELSSEGYQFSVEGPEGNTETFEPESTKLEYTPETAGTYTVNLEPSSNIVSNIGNVLFESDDSLAEVRVKVTDESKEWEEFCTEQGYETGESENAVRCIRNEIIPEYFEGEVGENPGIAQSMCRDLLQRNYNSDRLICE